MFLEFAQQQLANHMACVDCEGAIQAHKIEGTEEEISHSKRKHQRNNTTGIFQRKALVRHTVLLSMTTGQMVLVSRTENLLVSGSLGVRPLLTIENGKVIVGEESTSVTLRTKSRTK